MADGVLCNYDFWWFTLSRSSSAKVRIRVFFLSVVYFRRGTLPQERGEKGRPAWGPGCGFFFCPSHKPSTEFSVSHLRGQGEARRHRQPDGRHLRQVGALAAQQVLHPCPAVRLTENQNTSWTLCWRFPPKGVELFVG